MALGSGLRGQLMKHSPFLLLAYGKLMSVLRDRVGGSVRFDVFLALYGTRDASFMATRHDRAFLFKEAYPETQTN